MIGYANYVDQERTESSSSPDPIPAPVNFERGPRGLPLLPAEVKGVRGMEIAKNAQEIIRSYFLRHYREAFWLSNWNDFLNKFLCRTGYWV